jgi:hypothetical protein
MPITRHVQAIRGTWIEGDVRRLLGVFGPHARIYNVHSAGDSGEGCEVIEFTTSTPFGMVPWAARVKSRMTTRSSCARRAGSRCAALPTARDRPSTRALMVCELPVGS